MGTMQVHIPGIGQAQLDAYPEYDSIRFYLSFSYNGNQYSSEPMLTYITDHYKGHTWHLRRRGPNQQYRAVKNDPANALFTAWINSQAAKATLSACAMKAAAEMFENMSKEIQKLNGE